MRRVVRTSLTIAMATVMIGFVVTKARADRVSYSLDRCFGVNCVSGQVRIGELALAFSESSLGVLDAVSATAIADFSPELAGTSGLSFAGAPAKTQSSATAATAAVRGGGLGANAAPVMLSAGRMTLSSSRLQLPAYNSSAVDLGRAVNGINSGSFSVTGANLSANKFAPFQANDVQPGDIGDDSAAPVPNPEPTTMLLLGTGLACAAAIVRKRLKVRGANSK